MNETEIKKMDYISDVLKAIAHPTRIAMIDLLNTNKKLYVFEIQKSLNIEQAVASHHLNILKNKGVLQCKREGKKCFYLLKNKKIAGILLCVDQTYFN